MGVNKVWHIKLRLHLGWTRYLSIRNWLQKPVHALWITPGLTASGSQTTQLTELSPTFRGPSLVLCRFPSCQSRMSEVPLVYVSCLCNFPTIILTYLSSYNPSFLLLLDSRISAQCLAMNLYICFHQVLDEGSMITIRVVINLITKEGQLRNLLGYD